MTPRYARAQLRELGNARELIWEKSQASNKLLLTRVAKEGVNTRLRTMANNPPKESESLRSF